MSIPNCMFWYTELQTLTLCPLANAAWSAAFLAFVQLLQSGEQQFLSCPRNGVCVCVK